MRRRPIPVYREDSSAQLAIPVYNFLFKKEMGPLILMLTGIFAGPMNHLSFGVGVPIFIYTILMGVAPNLVPERLHGYYWYALYIGFFIGPGFTMVDATDRLMYAMNGRQLHEDHAYMRPFLIISGILGFLWPLMISLGYFDDKLGIFSPDFFRESIILFLLYLFPTVRFLMGLSWTLAIEYKYVEEVATTEGGQGGRKDDQLPPVGTVLESKDGTKVNPKAMPTEMERQALEWKIGEKLVLSQKTAEEIISLILLLRHYKAYYDHFGADIPKGVLLVGPPGTGKTTIAKFIAENSGLAFVTATPSELRSKWVGDSAKLVANLFRLARAKAPAVVFIDEIESVFPVRGDNEEVNHLVGQVLQELEGIHTKPGETPIVLIGATNHPGNLDPAVASRMGTSLYIPLPDTQGRERILEILLKDKELEGVDIARMALLTEGFSGRDLRSMVTGAAKLAFTKGRTRIREEDLLSQIPLIRKDNGDGSKRG
ncbi:MAG: ATP-binding protein [Thermus sp.]|nr:ATP-binding protein [Thermus sp.]